jgi:hypothetical protein
MVNVGIAVSAARPHTDGNNFYEAALKPSHARPFRRRFRPLVRCDQLDTQQLSNDEES